jgi:hypothetical protein
MSRNTSKLLEAGFGPLDLRRMKGLRKSDDEFDEKEAQACFKLRFVAASDYGAVTVIRFSEVPYQKREKNSPKDG